MTPEELRAACLAHAEASPESGEAAPEQAATVKGLQLSLPGFAATWHLPNEYARAALFGIVRRGRRRYLKQAGIAAWAGNSIRYTGEQLDQADLDVLMACASMINNADDGIVRTTHRALLKAAGRSGTGQRDIEWLRGTLSRMTACDVTLENERYVYHGNILNSAEDKDTGELVICLNPQQRWLWSPRKTTRLNLDQRAALGSDLSKWMQAYVCSHKTTPSKPHFVGLDKLQPLTGSTSPRRNFRIAVRKAMGELQAADVVAVWELAGDVLAFVR